MADNELNIWIISVFFHAGDAAGDVVDTAAAEGWIKKCFMKGITCVSHCRVLNEKSLIIQ